MKLTEEKSNNNLVTISVCVRPKRRDAIKRLSKKINVSQSKVVDSLLKEALKNCDEKQLQTLLTE